jgi:hypothetical protein
LAPIKSKTIMNKTTKILLALSIAFLCAEPASLFSQMKMSTGIMNCNIDGDTITFGLNTDLNDLYFMTMGGTAETGVLKIQWDGVKTPADVKIQTLKLEEGFVEDRTEKISLIWADFYTNLPYIIKKGTLSVTENTGSTIKGNIEITAEVGGSSVISEFVKGKKQTIMKYGYFEVNY